MAGAMLLLAAGAAGPAKAAELDGALLDAYQRWLPYEHERETLYAGTGEEPDYQARFDAHLDPWIAGVFEMMALPARTPEGITVKAEVLRALLKAHAGYGGKHDADGETHQDFTWSLVNDMLGRAGA